MSEGFLSSTERVKLYKKLSANSWPIWHSMTAAVRTLQPAPTTILDIGSGPGEPALTLSKEFPQAQIICSDLMPNMVSQAAREVAEAGRSDFICCKVLNMQDMRSIESNSQDVVTASLSLMFAPDLDKALAEIKRVLRPKGIMVGAVWQEAALMPIAHHIMKTVLAGPPPTKPNNPHTLAEPVDLDMHLFAADLTPIAPHNRVGLVTFDVGAGDDAWKLGMLPLYPQLAEVQSAGTHGNVFDVAKAAFEDITEKHKTPAGNVVLPPSIYRLVAVRKALVN